MIGTYEVVTLCGSTKFKEEYIEMQKRLTIAGKIVISVGVFGHSGDDIVWTDGLKDMLDDMHKRKIDMADRVFIINKNGYIGDSTRSEIAYAKETGKVVTYMEPAISDMSMEECLAVLQKYTGIASYSVSMNEDTTKMAQAICKAASARLEELRGIEV